MKQLLWFSGLLLIGFIYSCNEQQQAEPVNTVNNSKDTSPAATDPVSNPYAAVDVSPMDMSYFPVDYPKLKMAHTIATPPLARVVYSRPHLGGRKFHGVLKYGEPWRLGANEASELHLFSSATIQNKKIPAGRYVMYCIPQADKWTLVINTNIDSWGLSPDTTKDIARFEIPVKTDALRLEFFTMVFEQSSTGADLVMGWDTYEARLPLTF